MITWTLNKDCRCSPSTSCVLPKDVELKFNSFKDAENFNHWLEHTICKVRAMECFEAKVQSRLKTIAKRKAQKR